MKINNRALTVYWYKNNDIRGGLKEAVCNFARNERLNEVFNLCYALRLNSLSDASQQLVSRFHTL